MWILKFRSLRDTDHHWCVYRIAQENYRCRYIFIICTRMWTRHLETSSKVLKTYYFQIWYIYFIFVSTINLWKLNHREYILLVNYICLPIIFLCDNNLKLFIIKNKNKRKYNNKIVRFMYWVFFHQQWKWKCYLLPGNKHYELILG